mmetsp:Transcript_61242/g.172650  ORF Transcript_61242/g.172650 Transcript_61242/m.172650 type:complete len:226 (-) Transcript_61242:1400-2077(-)
MALQSPWCCTLHFAKERSTRIMSTGRSSFARVERNAAAALKRSLCTRRISERMANRAVSCTGAKLLCRASAARPTDAKNLCSEKPTDTKAARQQFSSCGAKVMSREDISEEAALKKPLENSGNRPVRLLLSPRLSADQDAKVLVSDVNWVLVNSFSLGISMRLSSARKSPLWWFCSTDAPSIFWSSSTTCCGVKEGNLISTSLLMWSTSSEDWMDCTRAVSASNS